jgi:tetrahydrodipicolinate N-succinyltransferase
METKIILYGASGHCKVIIDILECNHTEISAIIDENPKIDSILNRTVCRPSEINLNNSDSLILSIGNNRIRKELSAKLIVKYATAIHPSSIISDHSKMGEGTVVMASAVINAAVSIGKHSIINTGAIILNDFFIEDFGNLFTNVYLV